MESWFVEQPKLSEELLVAAARRNEVVFAAEARYLEEIDKVCAVSSPRVAFERRLDYLAGTRTWDVSCGMRSGEPCSFHDDEDDDEDDDDDEGPYEYSVIDTFGFALEWEDGTREFLTKDHGNVVEFGEVEHIERDNCSQHIYFYPGTKEEDADDGNKEKGGDST
jgi:hypothetical protein